MIYATHKLYHSDRFVATFKVVEIEDGCVSNVYDFECEKHSMVWYDAIVLSPNNCNNRFFATIADVLRFFGNSNSDSLPLYAYGITYDTDECMVTRLA